MADDTDSAQISFTANIESLQEGIQMGEDLIKEFTGEIATLQERISALSEVGGDWAALGAIRQYTAGIEDVSAKTDILREKLAQVTAEQARMGVTQFKPASLQFAIDESMRLNETMSSASASARVFQNTLGNVGISATEMAIQEREAAAATDALNRSQGSFFQSQAAGRAAVTSNLSALQGQSAAYQGTTVALGGFGTASARANQEITAGTSMFRAAAGAMGQFSVRTSGAARELIVLAHEVASGRYSRIPGSLMVMGEMMTGLSIGAAAATLGIMAVVGAIGYFTYRAIELANTVRDIQIGAQFAGNADISNQAIESTILEMAKMQGMTRATAEEVVSQFARMRGQTAQDLDALTKLTATYSQATGETAKQAAEKLSAAMQNENMRLSDLARLFPGLTALQLEHTQAIMETGNANEREAAIELATQENLDKSRDAIIRKDSAMTSSFTNFIKYSAALEAGMSYEEIQTSIINEQAAAYDKHAAAVRNDAAALAHRKLNEDQMRMAADIAADVENPMSQIDQTKLHIKQLEDAMDALSKKKGFTEEDGAKINKWNEAVIQAQGHLAQLQHAKEKKADFGTNLEGNEEIRATKELNAAVSADIALSAQQQHDIIAGNWKKLLDEGKLTKDQRVEVEKEMHTAIGAAARAGSVETIAQARDSVATINATERTGAVERLAAIVAVWAQIKDSDKLGYQQRLQAAIEFHKAQADLAKTQESIATADAKSNAETAITLGHLKLQEERAIETESFKLHQTSAAERTRILSDLADKEEKIDEDALTAEMQVIGKGNAGYQEAYNKILVLREQLKNEKIRIGIEEQQEDAQNARQSVTEWRRAVDEITSAENQMITGIIGGRENMSQILARMINTFVEKELEADATYLTKHLLLSNAELAADKTADQAGLLYKSIIGTQKVAVEATTQAGMTSATASGAATRMITQESADAAVNNDVSISLSKWIAKELGMTSATEAGVTARTEAQTAGAGSGLYAIGHAAHSAIMADAGQAAAGAYASASQVPFIGWLLGPAAAAAAFAAVTAYDSLTGLAVGAWEVPHDMPAYVHKGETVVPKTFAEGLRTSGSIAGTTVTSKGGNVSHLTYAPTINAPAAKSLSQHLASESSAMLEFIRSAQRDGQL